MIIRTGTIFLMIWKEISRMIMMIIINILSN